MNKNSALFSSIAQSITQKSVSSFEKLLADLHINHQNPSHIPICHASPKRNKSSNKNDKLVIKRNQLLKQLNQVNMELQRNKFSKKQTKPFNQNRAKSQMNQQLAYSKASQLISRMNHYRLQKKIKKRNEQQKLERQVQKSRRKLQLVNKAHEQQVQRKREYIKHKIQARRQNLLAVSYFNKKADNLISQMQEYRVSLPAIKIQQNPQQNHTQKKTSPKKFKKSPFLVTIQRQQRQRRRNEKLKEWERKNLLQKQKNFDRQVRSRIKQSGIYIT